MEKNNSGGPLTGTTENLELEKICTQLAEDFKGILFWKPDDRFQAVLGEFERNDFNTVRQILDKYFIHCWSSSTIYHAPKHIQKIGSGFGGLLPGQLLFTTEPENPPIVCGAWWPWGSGYTISIRISSSISSLSDSGSDVFYNRFKKWFGI